MALDSPRPLAAGGAAGDVGEHRGLASTGSADDGSHGGARVLGGNCQQREMDG